MTPAREYEILAAVAAVAVLALVAFFALGLFS